MFIIFVCKKPIWMKIKKTKWGQLVTRKKSVIRTEKKRCHVNEGFVKSGETTFSVLSTGSAMNNIEMIQMENPASAKEQRKETFSKENFRKSMDDIYNKTKKSKLGNHIMNKYFQSSSHELHTDKNPDLGRKRSVTLSSFTLRGDNQD